MLHFGRDRDRDLRFLAEPHDWTLSHRNGDILGFWCYSYCGCHLSLFEKSAKYIGKSSPYKRWKFLGIPAVTFGAVVNLIYLAILAYFFFFMPGLEELTISSGILYAVIWVLGILWYFYWKNRNKQVGVDVDMTFGRITP